MRWKSHVRFGGRGGETHLAKAGQGAPLRPLQHARRRGDDDSLVDVDRLADRSCR